MDGTSDASADAVGIKLSVINADSQLLKISRDVNKTSPQPKNGKKEQMHSEMIPQDLLCALTEVNRLMKSKVEELAPVKTLKTPKEMRVDSMKDAPDSVLRHRSRRLHFRHLTEPAKSMGKTAGSKDVSFLCDASAHGKKLPKAPSQYDKSATRFQAITESSSGGSSQDVQDSIIPAEYHLVKSKAVIGLDYVEDATSLLDRENALRVFPSLKPIKRFEVVQLIKTMDQMLARAGVDDADTEVKGPTQIRNLLDAIKREQKICDIVFHEVIRQVAVDCPERGHLISKLRERYARLLNRIPRQIISLKAEVLAQRSLDGRLTEELLKFKASIGTLTKELIGVREHDKKITEEAELAQIHLAEALKESQKNANLVDEYHDLYELQRQRLEGEVGLLTNERDMWCNAAYSLALKAISENSLSTAKRLHVTEKAWHKLAGHFIVAIGDHDTESLVELQQHVEGWRELLFHFHQVLEAKDKISTSILSSIRDAMKQWITVFHDKLIECEEDTDKKTMKLPPKEMTENFQRDVATWLQKLGDVMTRFSGDELESNRQELIKMDEEVGKWTDVAMTVYDRHRSRETGESYHMALVMRENTELFGELTKQLEIQFAGKNGTVKGIIKVLEFLEVWNKRIVDYIPEGKGMSDKAWLIFYETLLEYEAMIEETLDCIGSVQNVENWDEEECIRVEDMINTIQRWLKDTVDGIEAENGQMAVEVSEIHSRNIHWMVGMLLLLAPGKDSTMFLESELPSGSSVLELAMKCHEISEQLCSITAYLCQCVHRIVELSTQQKRDVRAEDADREARDFARLKSECKEWIRTCQLLLNTLMEEPITLIDEDILTKLDQGKLMERTLSKHQKDALTKETGRKVSGDKNVAKDTQETQEVSSVQNTKVKEKPSGVKELKKSTEEDAVVEGSAEMVASSEVANTEEGHVRSVSVVESLAPPSSVLTQTAYDAIAKMDELQKQLLVTEERAQEAEMKSLQLGEDLTTANEMIRALEKELALVENQHKLEQEPYFRVLESAVVDRPSVSDKPPSPERASRPVTPEQGKKSSSRPGTEKKKPKSKKK